METQDLMDALAPIEPAPGSKLERITKLFDEVASLLPDVDLAEISDQDLQQDDATARIRRTYILTLNRIYQFMRKNFDTTTVLVMPPKDVGGDPAVKSFDVPNVKAQIEQAKVALGYVRHLESMKLSALQLGKNPKDNELKQQVAELRAQLAGLAEARSRLAKDVASTPEAQDGPA